MKIVYTRYQEEIATITKSIKQYQFEFEKNSDRRDSPASTNYNRTIRRDDRLILPRQGAFQKLTLDRTFPRTLDENAASVQDFADIGHSEDNLGTVPIYRQPIPALQKSTISGIPEPFVPSPAHTEESSSTFDVIATFLLQSFESIGQVRSKSIARFQESITGIHRFSLSSNAVDLIV